MFLLGITCSVFIYWVAPPSWRAFKLIWQQGAELALRSPLKYTLLGLAAGFGMAYTIFATGFILYLFMPYPLVVAALVSIIPFWIIMLLQITHMRHPGDDGWGRGDDDDNDDGDDGGPWGDFDNLRAQWDRQRVN